MLRFKQPRETHSFLTGHCIFSFPREGTYFECKARLLKVADRLKELLSVTGLKFSCSGGIGKRTYGELISQIGTLNPRVVEEPWTGFKPFYKGGVAHGGLRV